MTPTTTLPPPTILPYVQTFAEQKGIAAYLPAVLALASRLVPGRSLYVDLRDDSDPEDRGYIAILFNDTGMTPEELMAVHVAWFRGIHEICPEMLKCRFHFDSECE